MTSRTVDLAVAALQECWFSKEVVEIRQAWIFVAVLGASNFTYAEVTRDWRIGFGAHTRAPKAIGGVPRLIVPDSTKTAAIKARPLLSCRSTGPMPEMAAHLTHGPPPDAAHAVRGQGEGSRPAC